MLYVHPCKNKIHAVMVFITCVISLYPGLPLTPDVQAQDAGFLGSRFFTTTITPNDKPLLAKAFFNDSGGNTVVLGAPLVDVISKAYGLPAFQIVDGPEWIHTAHLYDIEAVPPPEFVESNEEQMLQAMLADRFGFVGTKTTREMRAMVLELKSDALKFELVAENATNPDTPRAYLKKEGDHTNFAGNFTLDEFAFFLSKLLSKPVVNQTGLIGKYLIQVDGLIMSAPNSLGMTILDPNSLIKPMQEQLGLSLELKDTLADVLVVSRIEHPTLDD